VERRDAAQRAVHERRVELRVRIEERNHAARVPRHLLKELAVGVQLAVRAMPEALPLLDALLPLLDLREPQSAQRLEVVVDHLIHVLRIHVPDRKVHCAALIHLVV